MNQRKKMSLAHHPSAQDDSVGRKGADVIADGQGQIGSFHSPGGMVRREFRRRVSPAGFYGWTGSQALQAIAMVGANAREGVAIGPRP